MGILISCFTVNFIGYIHNTVHRSGIWSRPIVVIIAIKDILRSIIMHLRTTWIII